ncbi:MAG: TlpA family protein disulfide reductase [Micrococcales bacterium]
MKRLATGLLAVGLVFGLSACANDPLAEQFKAGTNKNYVAGDGSVTEFNGKLVSGSDWTSTTFDGREISSKSLLGHVTVLNFWYAGCAPCRAETPDLAKIASQYEEKGVYVVGVNVRDTAATAAAFARTHNLNYPSVMDIDTGSVVQAYTGVVSPSAVPTTLILNSKGEVTSRVLGRFDPSILRTLIDTALKG